MSDPTPAQELWDRQADEPNRWFARFEGYRLAGPNRSVVATWKAEQAAKGREKQTKVPGAWNQAALRWRWRERAEAWDEQQLQQARLTHARDIDDMNRRHIQEAQALQNKGIQRLKSLKLEELSPSDVLRYLVEATKLERTARGEPETIEERRLTGTGGGAIRFALEDALAADQELEQWQHDRLQPPGDPALPEGSAQVP